MSMNVKPQALGLPEHGNTYHINHWCFGNCEQTVAVEQLIQLF